MKLILLLLSFYLVYIPVLFQSIPKISGISMLSDDRNSKGIKQRTSSRQTKLQMHHANPFQNIKIKSPPQLNISPSKSNPQA